MAQAGDGMGGIMEAAGAGIAAPPVGAGLGAIGARLQPRFDIPIALTTGGPPKQSDISFEIRDKL